MSSRPQTSVSKNGNLLKGQITYMVKYTKDAQVVSFQCRKSFQKFQHWMVHGQHDLERGFVKETGEIFDIHSQ